ncbi:MAG: nucleotidyltransferase family protein [Gammaproteobacteria bacterium]
MDKAAILETLSRHRGEIMARFGAKHISLFGSAARDELRDESDIDVLVEFERAATYDGYFGLKDYLEGLLGRPVDLVTEKGLKPRARSHVEKDLIRVA